MRVRPFRWYGVTELAVLEAKLGGLLQPWLTHWGLADSANTPVAAIRLRQGEEIATHRGVLAAITLPVDDLGTLSLYGDARCTVALEHAAFDKLISLLLKRALPQGVTAHPLSAALVDRVISQLLVTVCQGSKTAPDFADVAARASGWVLADVSLPSWRFDLLLSPSTVAAWLPSPARQPVEKAVSLAHALRDREATASAELAGISLSLGELMSLAEGDILRVPHPMNEPVFVRSATGETLCRGRLAKQGEHRVIKITA